MLMRRLVLITSLAAFAGLVPVRPAHAQTGPMYWVCEHNTRTVPTSTLYVSDVTGPYGARINTGYSSDYLDREFGRFLIDTYKLTGAPSHCTGYESVARAEAWIKTLIQRAASAKVVETHWKSAVPPQPDGKNPADSQPLAPLHAFCWIGSGNNPATIYISRAAVFGRINIQGVPNEYAAYIEQTYGVRQSASCPASRDAAETNAERQRLLDQIRRTTKAVTFVELDWAPPSKPVPATGTPVAAATPPPLAAPRSNTAAAPANKPPVSADPISSGPASTPKPSAPANAAPPAPPAAQAPPKYSYCYAYGTPEPPGRGAAKQHFYISQPFQATSYAGLNQEFEAFIRGGHPGEKISASCLALGPLETAQTGRQTVIALRRKQTATFDVVEVDWKR